MSAFTLSMTSSSFMLLQHSEYINYDASKQRRTRGFNDPPLHETLIGTILYLFITVPRIFANSLIFAITPIMAVAMYLVELSIFLWYSHKWVVPFDQNLRFPSGMVTAFTNFFSACGPLVKVGWINLFSNILLILKVILLYPIVYFDTNSNITVDINKKPDQIRCWNESTITELNTHRNSFPRKCVDELPNDLLFHTVLPTTIGVITIVSILFGFLIPFVFLKKNISLREEYVKALLDRMGILIQNIKNLCQRKLNQIQEEEYALSFIEKVNVDDKPSPGVGNNALKPKKPLIAETHSFGENNDETNKNNSVLLDEEKQDTGCNQDNIPNQNAQKSCEIVSSIFSNVRTIFDDMSKDDNRK